jgi:hypothetical protein
MKIICLTVWSKMVGQKCLKMVFLISKALSEILSIKLIRLLILGVSKFDNKMNSAILSEKYQNDVFM